jgi:Meiotically up-regulated gene 113
MSQEPILASHVQARQMPSGEGPGYVYAIVAPEAGRVKIGQASTDRLYSRYAQIRTACPFPTQLHSATYHRMRVRAERHAHRLLGHARLHLEWFDLHDQAVQDWLSEQSAVQNFRHALAEELEALLVNR